MSEVPSPEQHLVLARLREEIRRLERRPGRRQGVVACGFEAVDRALPGGGFPRGALSELTGGPASGKTAVALSVLSRLGQDELFAWIDGRAELYPPAAAARGVDLDRLLVVRPPAPPGGEPPWRAGLWAAEALLASGAFGAVVIEVPLPRAVPGAESVARRIQAAVDRGGAVGLWLGAARTGLRVPAAVRLELSAEHGRIVASRAGARPGTPFAPRSGAGEGAPEARAGGSGHAA
jgi:protein ImuA